MGTERIAGRVWLEREGQGLLGPGRAELLERIDELGSMAGAARAMGMGYKHAWDMVEAMNNRAEAPLVERVTGGRGGGGTRLTEAGRTLVAELRAAEAAYQRFLGLLSAEGGDPARIRDLMGRLTLRTSARNHWWGRVTAVRPGPLNAEVALALGGGTRLVARVTNASVRELAIAEGAEVAALVKAPHVRLEADSQAPADNRLGGTVEAVIVGDADAEVTLRLPGGNSVVAVTGHDEIGGLAAGDEACAHIRADHIILAVNG
jgi:molybdate transport system regulatory protein